MNSLSQKQSGTLTGFSIELSIANQLLGRNSSLINVPFLNYLQGIRSRAGAGPVVRVGGNSQESTEIFLETFQPHHEFLNKTVIPGTITPEVNIALDLFYAMSNISTFVDVQWYAGLPFAAPLNLSGIATMTAYAEQVLGDNLIALQLGNEPDLYVSPTGTRPTGYSIQNFMSEWNQSIQVMQQDSAITNESILIGPSICCDIDGQWSIDQVINAGYISTFNKQLKQLAVQYYPNDNCAGYNPPTAQSIFPNYLMHTMATNSVRQYLNASVVAQKAGKPFIMFETNTASCAGFPGLSDSFGAALWSEDYTLQLAYVNFTNVLFHFGGQNSSYNPFTPPPSNWSQALNNMWSTGPVYYSALMVTEALGSSNQSQIVDLTLNNNNPYTVGYAIYENGNPMRVVLINFMNDPTGASDFTATVAIGGGTSGQPAANPTSATVRYLSAPSVTEKRNITWAGQSWGALFSSDGRPQGNVSTLTVQCNSNNGCPVKVPAPGAALVFLSDQSVTESGPGTLTETFTTSVYKYPNEPTIAQAVLATSNGRGGKGQPPQLLDTSKGQGNGDPLGASVSVLCILLAALGASIGLLLRG
ncbi:uncharacterized protein EI90DRAFT_2934654 [Cantharellus anzutake]|uniref:uncharacterized protein n=1 Tax=Cantharellus anzutake TaxID=1750568 RepID=UPI00190538CF|nr:uncharacterized protein EI90DRAFT_2934654 [Cantharellus anzutake]KAF8324445.1 hypothetical protein EI90DRAFT_2934654 [Cantharellus anzutake]